MRLEQKQNYRNVATSVQGGFFLRKNPLDLRGLTLYQFCFCCNSSTSDKSPMGPLTQIGSGRSASEYEYVPDFVQMEFIGSSIQHLNKIGLTLEANISSNV